MLALDNFGTFLLLSKFLSGHENYNPATGGSTLATFGRRQQIRGQLLVVAIIVYCYL